MALSGLLLRIPAALARGHAIKSSESLFVRSNSTISCRSNVLSALSGRSKTLLLDKKIASCVVPCCASRAHTQADTHKGKSHDHTNLWRIERIVSLVLIPVVPAALINPCEALDATLAVLAVMHNHWGIESIVIDYVRPILFGNVVPVIARGLVYLVSVLTLAGLLQLINSGEGIANVILHFWKA